MTNVARLPGPIADIWDWQRMGLCRGRDSAQFFHPDGERGASRGRRETAAKQLCHSCPVRAECAAHALATREPYGVWGGFTEAERLRLLATGWEDAADRQRARVDVGRLEARIGLRPTHGQVSRRDQLPSGSPVPAARRPEVRVPASRNAVPSMLRVVPAPRSGVAPRPAVAR
jgi:WhiB family redox-sensing transcriptional regulator